MYAVAKFLIRFGVVELPDSTSDGKLGTRFETDGLFAFGCRGIDTVITAALEGDVEFSLPVKGDDVSIGGGEIADDGLGWRGRHEGLGVQREAIDCCRRGGIERVLVDADAGGLI